MLSFVIALSALACANGQSPPEVERQAESQIFAELNQARAEAGVPPLTLDPKLTVTARRHSSLMAQQNKLSHQFPGEPTVSERLQAERVYFTQAAENAGVNSDVSNITAMFLASPGHRTNMLNPLYNSAGVGIVRSGRSYWITADFAQELPYLSADEAADHAATAVTAKWSAVHPEPLKRVEVPELHALACTTARRGRLQHQPVSYGKQTARRLFAFSTPEPSSLNPQVDGFLDMPHLQIFSVAACTPQESGDKGHFWILLAFF